MREREKERNFTVTEEEDKDKEEGRLVFPSPYGLFSGLSAARGFYAAAAVFKLTPVLRRCRPMEKKTLMGSPRVRPPCTRPLRWAKTLFFLLTMLASLLLDCAPPLLVVVLDLLLPPALLSAAASPPSLELKTFRFRSSLIDLPIVSAARSLLILCAFLLCDGSRGLYLAITALCSSASVVYVLAKLFSMSSSAAASPRQALAAVAGKDAAALIEATFLASLAMAIAHVVVAYRTSCRERRKLLVYRIDIEAVKVKGGLIKEDCKL